MTGEFDLIARHFAPLAGPGGLGLKDDAAILKPPPGMDLVLTADAAVAGVHFLADETPDIIARRTLRTNLSDLAAKGARPLGYLVTLALPDGADDAWAAAFASGLKADQDIYGLALLGGDTVATPGPALVSITAIGAAPEGRMIRRAGAAAGDDVWVTGAIGDGGLGLMAATGGLDMLSAADRDSLAQRFRLPEPPAAFGPALAEAGLASAAADVSDGLVADAGHIADASGLRLEIDAAAVPLSAEGRRALDVGVVDIAFLATAGDDYQIVFTAPAVNRSAIERLAAGLPVSVARIGRAIEGDGHAVLLDADGAETPLAQSGYRHR